MVLNLKLKVIQLQNNNLENDTLRRKRAQSVASIEKVSEYGPKELISTISKNDEMSTDGKHQKIYFSIGRSALKCIDAVILAADKQNDDIKTILDFACGHGRVLRVLKAAFPNCTISACDVYRDAVDFCKKTFDVVPVYSKYNIEDLTITSKFDLIWVGSYFTHIDQDDWEKSIKFLSSLLNPGGLLVFTTAGQFVYDLLSLGDLFGLDEQGASIVMKNFNEHGFGYAKYPSQTHNIGRTIVKPSYVQSVLEKHPDLRVITCTERGWAGRQDVFSCIKMSENEFSKNSTK